MLIFEWDPGVDGSRMDLYHYDRIGGRWNHKEELESRVLEGKDGFDGVQTRRGLQWIEIFTRSEEEMLISEYQLRDLRGLWGTKNGLRKERADGVFGLIKPKTTISSISWNWYGS
ncbi:unnamed protein product [Brassica rapa subsp. narinosa]